MRIAAARFRLCAGLVLHSARLHFANTADGILLHPVHLAVVDRHLTTSKGRASSFHRGLHSVQKRWPVDDRNTWGSIIAYWPLDSIWASRFSTGYRGHVFGRLGLGAGQTDGKKTHIKRFLVQSPRPSRNRGKPVAREYLGCAEWATCA